MLQIIEQTLKDKHCSVRLCAPEGDGFVASAVARNGLILAAGSGKTLKEALRDMLEDFGVSETEKCTVPTPC